MTHLPFARRLSVPLACAALLVAAACTAQTPRDAALAITAIDLLVEGDYVVTMDDANTLIENGAVAVHDGEIVAISSAADLRRRYDPKEVLNGRGRLVMPGLVNGHTHAAMTLLRGIADDLELMEWLEHYIFPAEVQFVDAEFVRIGTELACREMIRGGTTKFVDMYYFPDAVAEVVERCGLRAIVVPSVIDQQAPDAANGEESLAKARDFVARWKDRNSRIVPAIGAHSVYTLSPEWLKKVRDAAAAAHVPVSIHVSESPYEIEVTRKNYDATPVELLDGMGFFDNHTIAAHVVWPTTDDDVLLAKSGVGVIHNPTSNMKISSGVAPVARMQAAGILVGLGSDGAASNNDLDMWEEIRLASLLSKVSTMDPTSLPAATVLRMATSDGARAIGLGDTIGQLTPGRRADLIQVDVSDLSFMPLYDVVSHLVYVADEQDVTTVVVDGRILMHDQEVLTIDEGELRKDVTRIARRIREGVGKR